MNIMHIVKINWNLTENGFFFFWEMLQINSKGYSPWLKYEKSMLYKCFKPFHDCVQNIQTIYKTVNIMVTY